MKLRENGKRNISIAGYCILRHREEMRIIEARRYAKKLAYNRAWRKKNRDRMNEFNRRLYAKNRKLKKMDDLRDGAWFKEKNSTGFSHLSYPPFFHPHK